MTNQSSPVLIQKATPHEIPLIQDIAFKTWPVTYGNILSAAQLSYMLDLIYSSDALTAQMQKNHQFYLAYQQEQPVGFCDFSFERERTYKLNKIYVVPNIQKSGAGKA